MSDPTTADDWQTIGEIHTDWGAVAIVRPSRAEALGDDYERILQSEGWLDCDSGRGCFRVVHFGQEPGEWSFTGDDEADALLVSCLDFFDVQARFCDYLGEGHKAVCELRIAFHVHNDDGEQASA